MAKQAQRLAKKENRTMSELMREAFRRYQQQQETRPATLAEALRLLRADAHAQGLDKLTQPQIQATVAEAQREMAKLARKRAKKSSRRSRQ